MNVVNLKELGLERTVESVRTSYTKDSRTLYLTLVTKPRSFYLPSINNPSQVEILNLPSAKISSILPGGFWADEHPWMILEALVKMTANHGVYCDPRAFSKIEIAMDWDSSPNPVLRFLPLKKHPICQSYSLHSELECTGCGSQFYNPSDPIIWLGTPIGYVHERCIGSILSDVTPGCRTVD